MSKNGLVLFQTPDVVVIATGFASGSANSKPAAMIQIWLLNRHMNPVAARKVGADDTVCFDCPHRNGTCYVNLGQAPLAIWKCWDRGGYKHWDGDTSIFEGRKVRFGAYGDPVILSTDMIEEIANASSGWTGYTHQWRKHTAYKQWLMASVDSEAEAREAQADGWRTFRITPTPIWSRSTSKLAQKFKDEIVCPSSEEAGRKTTCDQCLLCNGSASKSTRNITIAAHGVGKKKLHATI